MCDSGSHHLRNHRIAVRCGGVECAADPTVAHHHNAVGDLEHLSETMRDEDDRDASLLERPHAIEQALGLAIG